MRIFIYYVLLPTSIPLINCELFVRSFLSSIAFICCSSYASISVAAPLTIDINDGHDAIPHEVGDVDQSTTSSFVQTINVAEMRETQLDLGQIIEKNSGVKIRRTGGIGSYSSISIQIKLQYPVNLQFH